MAESYYQKRNRASFEKYGVSYGQQRGILSKAKAAGVPREQPLAALAATRSAELLADLLSAQAKAIESQTNASYDTVSDKWGVEYDQAFRAAPKLFWYHGRK